LFSYTYTPAISTGKEGQWSTESDRWGISHQDQQQPAYHI